MFLDNKKLYLQKKLTEFYVFVLEFRNPKIGIKLHKLE